MISAASWEDQVDLVGWRRDAAGRFLLERVECLESFVRGRPSRLHQPRGLTSNRQNSG